ncbi:right-handed parallel beta-helix repeat-containing protein [Methanosarcina sp. UBA5]|uniref:right-handed parallel beta-helix repeat-containing protein n=1 Tax=Methanosarcina sp. UBA5 TaxID=1915593 RepID=UPI0025DA458C|nr:NosD domain-containing protein [Methanosarcina sp. UBA5]
MKGKSIQIICIIFLLVLGATVTQSGAAVLTVGINGGENYSFIQDAVNNAQNGDTIVVSPGIYIENINVNKEIAIISKTDVSGDMTNRTYVIGAVPANDVFSIKSNNVRITGFHILGGPSGIDAYQEVGLYLEGVQNCSLSNNTLMLNDVGIDLNNSHRNLLDNNQICLGSTGIVLSRSNENKLSNNLVETNDEGILLDNSTNNTLMNNTAESNDVGVLLDASITNMLGYNSISRNSYGVIIENMAGSNILTNNSLYMNGLGMHLKGSTGNMISLNKFFNLVDAVDEGTNSWNSSSAGNKWKNYNGTDADGNGIGDTPYVVNQTTGSIDYMPLANNVSSGK